MKGPLRKALTALALIAGLVAFHGCKDTGGGGDAQDSTNAFKFIVISDVHVRLPGNPDDGLYNNAGNIAALSEAITRINAEQYDADLVMITGDLTGCLFSSNPADYGTGADNPAEAFKRMMDSLAMPYYAALGNHDYEDGVTATGEGTTSSDPAGMEAVWKKVLGIDPYYSFVHKGVRFVVLNANRGPSRTVPCPFATVELGCEGSFDEPQLSWLEGELIKSEPCLLFVHHPLITDQGAEATWSPAGSAMQVRADDRFYSIAAANRARIRGVFVGHGHFWEQGTLNGTIPVYETGSIGDFFGSSSNIRVVEVDPATGSVTTRRIDE